MTVWEHRIWKTFHSSNLSKPLLPLRQSLQLKLLSKRLHSPFLFCSTSFFIILYIIIATKPTVSTILRRVKQENKNESWTDAQTATLTDIQNFQLLFHYLLIGANHWYVDAFSCVTFIKTFEISDHGVSKLVTLYQSSAIINIHRTDNLGLSLETDTQIVISLVWSLWSFIYSSYKSEGFGDNEVNDIVKCRNVWYCIVDRNSSNKAFRWMVTNTKNWKTMTWFVTELRSGFPVDRCQKLSRVQDHRHSPNYYIFVTFYD